MNSYKMCNIFLCMLKIWYVSSSKFTLTNEFLCIRTTYGNYHGAEISGYLSRQMREYVVNDPEIIQITFSSSVLGNEVLYNDFKYFTNENRTNYFLAGNNNSKFDANVNVMDGVLSSVCKQKNYWLFLDYAVCIEYKQKNIIESFFFSEDDIHPVGKDLIGKTDNFIAINKNGTIIIPDIKRVNDKWVKTYNQDFSDKTIYSIIENIWNLFYKNFNSKITIEYI